MNNRVLPHSVEAEQSVLGSMILDNDVASLVVNKIETIHFYKEAHKAIFESMVNLMNENKPIDLLMLTEQLKLNNQLNSIGGVSYITSLSAIVPTTSNVNQYIEIVLEKYTRRQAISVASDIINKLYNGRIKELETDAESLKNVLVNNKKIENMYVNASEIKRNKKSSEFISTGFKVLDNFLGGGFKCTSLTILTGEPGSGKSTILNQIIAGALADKHKSFLYSGELPGSDLMFWFKRTVANDHHIVEKNNKVGHKYKDITNYCWDLISKWIDGKLFIYGDDSIANKSNMLATIEHLAINKGIKFFVLDNLMTFDIGEETKQYREQKQLCLSLKQLAKKYGIAIVLVAHPKKPSDKDKPSMYDVSGASEIVGCADTVIRTVRPEDENQDSKILLLKNRWGGATNKAFSVKFNERRKRYYTNGSELERDYGYDTNKEFSQTEIENPF